RGRRLHGIPLPGDDEEGEGARGGHRRRAHRGRRIAPAAGGGGRGGRGTRPRGSPRPGGLRLRLPAATPAPPAPRNLWRAIRASSRIPPRGAAAGAPGDAPRVPAICRTPPRT